MALVVLHTIGGPGSGPGQFDAPTLVCFSPWPSRSLLVAEYGNNRVQEVDVLAPAHLLACGDLGLSAPEIQRRHRERHSARLS